MYDIFTLEVMEDFKAARRGGQFTVLYSKGDIIQVEHSLDKFHKERIAEGKFKLIGNLLGDSPLQ